MSYELAMSGVASAKMPSGIRLETLRKTTYNLSHESLYLILDSNREPEGQQRIFLGKN
jgi:hypothetical protein